MLTLRQFTHKLRTPLALLTAPRYHTLQALLFDTLKMTSGRASFIVTSLLTMDQHSKPIEEVVEVEAYPPDRRLKPLGTERIRCSLVLENSTRRSQRVLVR